MNLDTLGRMKQCRIWMTLNHPFYGSLLQGLDLRIDNTQSTAYTNGNCIAFSDTFAQSLSDEEIKFVMAHEVLHCVYMHVFRAKALKGSNIDWLFYNQAADYRINWDLKSEKIGKMPPQGLYNTKYDREWTTMMIYHDLENQSKSFKDDGNGAPLDNHDQWELVEDSDGQKEQDMTGRIIGAYQSALAVGKEPKGVDRLIGELVSPKIPWEDLLFATITSYKRANKSWRRPNKRVLHKGIHLQGQGKSKTVNFAMALDTSGSVSDEDLKIALSETWGSMQHLKEFTLHVLNFDTEVQAYSVYKEGDEFDFKPTGCGGTDLSCISDFIDEREIEIEHLFVITDGYTCNWNKAGDYDTTFIMTTDVVAPHGETIHYDNVD